MGRYSLLYCLLAFICSLALLPFVYFIGDDGAYYARVAASLFAGGGISANPGQPYLIHPPFFPFLIGLVNLPVKNLELSGHLVALLAFTLTVVPLFFLAREIYSPRIAHWTSILYATNGFLLIHSNDVMTESLFVLLMVSLIYVIHQTVQGKYKRGWSEILTGALTGMAYLTRPEGALLFIVSILAVFSLSSASFVFKIRFLLLSLPVFLIFFLPYAHFLHRNSGQFQLSRGVTEIFIKRQLEISPSYQLLEARKIHQGLTSDKTRFKIDELAEKFNLIDYLSKDSFALIRSAPGSLIWRVLELNRYLFGGLGFFLIGASWLGAPWSPQRTKSELLLFLFLSTFLFKLLGQFLPRYFFHYFPILLLWMGNGIDVFKNWVRESFELSLKTSTRAALGICLFLALLSFFYVKRVAGGSYLPVEYKELGLWMKKHIPQTDRETVASRQPAVSFYSGAGILKLPYVDKFEDLLTFMAHQNARYFAVADDMDLPHRFTYQPLLDETKPLPRGIARVHTIKGKRTVALFEKTP